MTTESNSLGLIALEPVPTTHSAGITLYRPVTDENEILSHPEWPVYRDFDQARARLNRSVQAPANCSRVFNSGDLPFVVANRLGLQRYKWGTRANLLVVTSLPFLVSIPNPTDLHALLATRYPHLPVFGIQDDLLTSFLNRNPSFEIRKASDVWGCPSIGLRRLTKAGLPVRTPAEAIARKRASWNLLFCHPSLTRSLLSLFIETLTTPSASYSNRVSGSSHTPRGFTKNSFCSLFHTIYTPHFSSHVYGTRREPKTWSEHALVLSRSLSSLHGFLSSLLDNLPNTKSNAGNIRTPLTFLFHRRRHRVAEALSLFHPFLSYLRNTPSSDPYKKLSSPDLHAISTNNLSLLRNLYRLSHAMQFRTYPNLPVAHLLDDVEPSESSS